MHFGQTRMASSCGDTLMSIEYSVSEAVRQLWVASPVREHLDPTGRYTGEQTWIFSRAARRSSGPAAPGADEEVRFWAAVSLDVQDCTNVHRRLCFPKLLNLTGDAVWDFVIELSRAVSRTSSLAKKRMVCVLISSSGYKGSIRKEEFPKAEEQPVDAIPGPHERRLGVAGEQFGSLALVEEMKLLAPRGRWARAARDPMAAASARVGGIGPSVSSTR